MKNSFYIQEDLFQMIQDALSLGASDIHIQCNEDKEIASIYFRVKKQIVSYNTHSLSFIAIKNIFSNILGEQSVINEPSISVILGNIRCRISYFNAIFGTCYAIRLLRSELPTLESINAPIAISNLCIQTSGLILVCGATGVGKSTTIAAMINHINKTTSKHILTIEDPIEYIHESDKSLINQREINKDSNDFETALKSSLRQDPDVIMIGEILSPKVLELAITHALSGHLVISSFHAQNCMDAISRMIGMRQHDSCIHANLATCLQGIITQKLYDNGLNLSADFEILVANPAVRALIKEDKIWQLDSQISMGRAFGMQHFSKNM